MRNFVSNKRTYVRCSRWIKITIKSVTCHHRLYEYASDGIICSFRHNGKEYCLESFLRLSYPIFFENEDGKTSYLSGYDSETWYNPYLIEIDDNGEYVRLWEEREETT